MDSLDHPVVFIKNKITCWKWKEKIEMHNWHDFMDAIILWQNKAIMAYRVSTWKQNYKMACRDLNFCILQLIRTPFVLFVCVSIEMQI